MTLEVMLRRDYRFRRTRAPLRARVGLPWPFVLASYRTRARPSTWSSPAAASTMRCRCSAPFGKRCIPAADHECVVEVYLWDSGAADAASAAAILGTGSSRRLSIRPLRRAVFVLVPSPASAQERTCSS